MKATLFIILLFSISTLQAQIVNIPDPAFKERLLIHYKFGGDIIDTNGDGEIQVSEAEAITAVYVGDAFIQGDIMDMTGIEAFINITELHCFNNNISVIDLSQNLLLEYIDCQENWIVNLDVSQNSSLNDINCSNNLLLSLDVSQNSLLEDLICNNNSLLNLNVTQNDLLNIIWCKDNSLESLDVRNGNNTNIISFISVNNPDLTCIFVDDAAYSEANWSSTDPASTFVETQAECDALGINDNFFQRINIYPNPVNNILYIDNYDLRFTNNDLQIIDITGKTVQQLKISNQQSSINVSHLLTGIYFLQLQNNSSTILTKKIIKL